MTSKEIQEHTFKADASVYAEDAFQDHVRNFWLREIALQLAEIKEFITADYESAQKIVEDNALKDLRK